MTDKIAKIQKTRRRGTYYKIQRYDPLSLVWISQKSSFDSIADVMTYIKKFNSHSEFRIIKVEGFRKEIVTTSTDSVPCPLQPIDNCD